MARLVFLPLMVWQFVAFGALASDTIKIYRSAESLRAAKPDTSFYCDKKVAYSIKRNKKTKGKELRIKCRKERTLIGLSSAFLLVETSRGTYRKMPDGSLAVLKECDGLCLFQYKSYGSDPLHYSAGSLFYILDEGKWWFSQSIDAPALRLTRKRLRESFSSSPEFLAAIDEHFGKSEMALNAKNLSRRKKGEYVLLKLYKSYVGT